VTIYHYPKQHPMMGESAADSPTEAIDYIKFERRTLSYDGDGKTTGYTGTSLPDNRVIRGTHDDVVYLAMPPALNTAYNPSYRSASLGSVGASLASGYGRDSYQGIAQTIQEAAKAMQPEFSQGVITNLANNLSGMLGLQGNIDTNGLEALANGRVFNPYQEQLFAQMNFRQHQFSFKLYAKDHDEARDIKKILSWFKEGSLPKFTSGSYNEAVTKKGGTWKGYDKEGSVADNISELLGSDSDLTKNYNDYVGNLGSAGGVAGRRFMQIPDSFDISFKRFGDVTSGQGGMPLHFKVKRSVCNGIQVNYTPDNQYSAFMGRPDASGMNNPATVLALSFLEVEILEKDDVKYTGGF
tara:strand:+ start:192 stop:1253 length:1062 start_codon:yes stop_codon:yes gene_type:complete